MTIFTPDKLPSSDQAASSSSKLRDDLIDHRKQCAADKSAAVVKTNGLELKILQLGSNLRELASSEGKRIDFVVASLSRCIGDGDRKAQALMISYVDHHTNELRLQLFGEIGQVSERVDKVQADLKTYVQKSQTGLGQHIDDAKQELKTDIQKVDGHVGEGTQDLKGDISGAKDELKGDISGAKGDLKGEMQQVETRLNRRIDETKEDLKGDISGTKDDLKGEMQQVETRLNRRIDKTKDDLKGEMQQVETRLNRRIDKTKDDLKGEISSTKDDLKGEISSTKDDLKGEMQQIETRLNNRLDRPNYKLFWTTLIASSVAAFISTFGRDIFYSLFNAGVYIFEVLASFFS